MNCSQKHIDIGTFLTGDAPQSSCTFGYRERLRDELKILLSMKTTNNRLVIIENSIGQYPLTMKISSSF